MSRQAMNLLHHALGPPHVPQRRTSNPVGLKKSLFQFPEMLIARGTHRVGTSSIRIVRRSSGGRCACTLTLMTLPRVGRLCPCLKTGVLVERLQVFLQEHQTFPDDLHQRRPVVVTFLSSTPSYYMR